MKLLFLFEFLEKEDFFENNLENHVKNIQHFLKKLPNNNNDQI